MENLKFRRQYIIANRELSVNNGWPVIKLMKNPAGYYLYHHPDLTCHVIQTAGAEIILLGYAFDPLKPGLDEAGILSELTSARSYADVLTRTLGISGRYVLLYVDEKSVNLCNDATGFREIYYYVNAGLSAAGSTPKILADMLGIGETNDPDIQAFYNSSAFNDLEKRWLGEQTVYDGILHLVPNHWLDLQLGKTVRYWPVAERREQNLSETGDFLAELLTGTYEATAGKFKLYQGLTGGWDTRLLLAASRKYIKDIHYYFLRGFKSDSNLGESGDYTISTSIAAQHNIPLEVILLQREITDPEFVRVFYQNNHLARKKLLPFYFRCHQDKLDQTMTVAGTGSNETLRLMSSIGRNVRDARKIAGLMGYGDLNYAVNAVDRWLIDSKDLQRLNYKVIDIFYWEQLIGNWGALSGSEQDIVREELRPFNNRLIINSYLSLKDKFRYRDYPQAHVYIINKLWPELMQFDLDMRLAKEKKVLRRLGLEQFTDKVYQNLKKLK
jgi:hypothetical protein